MPNLVWLPSQLSKLSDREGGFVQSYLQALSLRIYRDVPLSPELAEVVNPIWKRLPVRNETIPVELPDPSTLNFFEFDPKWLQRRIASLRAVLSAIEQILNNATLQKKIIATRYGNGLPVVRTFERTATQPGTSHDQAESLSPGSSRCENLITEVVRCWQRRHPSASRLLLPG